MCTHLQPACRMHTAVISRLPTLGTARGLVNVVLSGVFGRPIAFAAGAALEVQYQMSGATQPMTANRML